MKANKSSLRNAEVISTGLPKLDDLLDGGVGLKRITQFSGRYSVGKSTIALNIVAKAQKAGFKTLWLDSEQRFPFEYAEALGVDLERLELEDIKLAEELFNHAESWAKKHEGIIVLDSVGGLTTRKEAERNSGDEGFPEAPKLIPAFIRRIIIELARTGSGLILLNHEKIQFDGTLKVLGGRSVEFHSDKWIRLRQLSNKKVMQGDQRVGDVIEAIVMKGKNKGKTCELALMAGQGFSVEQDKLQQMLDSNEITKQGRSFFYQGEKVASSMADAREWIKTLVN